MFIVGIDIAKNNHEATLIDRDSSVLGKPVRFANKFSGFQHLMDFIKAHAFPAPSLAYIF